MFLLGLLSLMDTILKIPMSEVLAKVPLDQETILHHCPRVAPQFRYVCVGGRTAFGVLPNSGVSLKLTVEVAVTARILVVDDMPAIRNSMRMYLEQEAGWVICGEAENGKVAIDQVKELRPDVVILDLSMPVMNGLDAARAIKAIAPGTHILMFTLHTYPYLLDEARKVGIDQVLSKAESFATELLQAVRTLVH